MSCVKITAMNQRENHNFHGNTWSYTVPHRKERICFACLTETLEDDAIIMVKKRPALAEALHLIQLQNFIDDLQSNIEIAVHFTFVLIGNLKMLFKTYFFFSRLKMTVCGCLIRFGSSIFSRGGGSPPTFI